MDGSVVLDSDSSVDIIPDTPDQFQARQKRNDNFRRRSPVIVSSSSSDSGTEEEDNVIQGSSEEEDLVSEDEEEIESSDASTDEKFHTARRSVSRNDEKTKINSKVPIVLSSDEESQIESELHESSIPNSPLLLPQNIRKKPQVLDSDSEDEIPLTNATLGTTSTPSSGGKKSKMRPRASPTDKNDSQNSSSSHNRSGGRASLSPKPLSGFLEAEDNLSKLMEKNLRVSPSSKKSTKRNSLERSEADKQTFSEASKSDSIYPKLKPGSQPKISEVFKSKKSPESKNTLEKTVTSSPKKSPDIEIVSEFIPNKKYSLGEIKALEDKIKKQDMMIDNNKRLLKKNINLPDNGSKLKAYIQKLVQGRSDLEKELKSAKQNNTMSSSNSSIDDSQKIKLLQNKLSILKQKYATTKSENTEEIAIIKQQISKAQKELLQCQESSARSVTAMGDHSNNNEKSAWQKIREDGLDLMNNVTWSQWAQGPAANQLYGGRMNQARKLEAISVTQEAIKKLHDSLDTMPVETDMEEDPLLLKKSINLFPHQKQALSWLLWRETQHPPGGILADDMGLGKTLTMISLILKSKELMNSKKNETEKEEEEWLETKEGKGLIRSKGTLIICPASLISQWEGEVKKRLKSDALNVLVYHGTSRGQSARTLARYDLVITTYHTIMNDLKSALGEATKGKLEEMSAVSSEGAVGEHKNIQLLKVAWERLILDEAHQIRNPKSKTAQAVCKLRSARRWCVTGTPIQNRELDMYSLIRFLRCAPFDEYRVWKTWVDNRTSQGQTRMNTLIKSLLLRRTKDQKSSATGNAIVELPEKTIVEHSIRLKEEEQKVYDKVFSLSQSAMINYMKKYHEEKGDLTDVDSKYKSKSPSKPGYTYKPPALVTTPKDVKAHHLLVLLLRLRQICCHPSLIQSMLDNEVKSTEGIEDEDGDDLDLISRMEDMSLGKSDKNSLQEEEKLLINSNPVFDQDTASSKIAKLVEALHEIAGNKETREKAVIVSQWTSMLNIVERYVDSIGLRSVAINGQVPVKARGEIVDEFNSESRNSPRIMLLSLGAGGVGLNLTGGNHLFLLDMHWNPQLEKQACDRVYRVGQKRPVWIHKFLCEDTVESRIHILQQKKISLADGVLTGAKRSGANKLSFEDLKMLFNVK